MEIIVNVPAERLESALEVLCNPVFVEGVPVNDVTQSVVATRRR